MQNQTIIDIHCHTAGIGAGNSGCFISPAMRRSWKFGIYLRAFGVKEKELLEQGDVLILAAALPAPCPIGKSTEGGSSRPGRRRGQ